MYSYSHFLLIFQHVVVVVGIANENYSQEDEEESQV